MTNRVVSFIERRSPHPLSPPTYIVLSDQNYGTDQEEKDKLKLESLKALVQEQLETGEKNDR